MSVINTNIKSLIVQNAIKVNNRSMAVAMEQLSTGKRINSAKDDAAGLAISESMTSQIRGLDMAVRNANDGISLAQTAEGAMIEISSMVQRMRELAVQAASGTLSVSQRDYLQLEYEALDAQISTTVSTTRWNGIPLLDGSLDVEIQVGPDESASALVQIAMTENMSALAVNGKSIAGADGSTAQATISDCDDALVDINSARATLGAIMNRLTSAANNLTNISQNTSESRSRILDTDYAVVTAELARTQIIQQASTAVLAQANAQPQTVLKLLQG